MNDPTEPTSFSASRIQLLLDQHAPDFRLDAWQRQMVESWLQATTGPQPVRLTVLTRRRRSALAPYTLRLTLLLTPRDTGYPLPELSSTAPIHPVILALAYSSMQEYHRWFSTVSIETIRDFVSSPT